MMSIRGIFPLRALSKTFGIRSQFSSADEQFSRACCCYYCSYNSYSSNANSSTHRSKLHFKLLGISGVCLGLAVYKSYGGTPVSAGEAVAGQRLDHLPNYSMEEVSKHCCPVHRIWVAYQNGVYDISDFVEKHPGGDQILMAAGGSVEPFWQIYGVHKQEHILSLLEEYRIGNLKESEVLSTGQLEDDPYRNEPLRHPALKPSSQRPFNAEPPPQLLVDSFITPQEIFYVRNHLPVPQVNLESYQLEIIGDHKTKTFTIDDLKKLPKYHVTASIQCAGNRRGEMSQVKAVKGLDWGHAAIGNATWSGIRLRDLLLELGLDPTTEHQHVHFEGLDCDPSGSSYAASIPIEKALDPRGDVLLAYEMNGEPLSQDHGFPLRAIVPGIVGARNVKWLGRIVVSESECDSHWQQNDYKGFCPSTDWDSVVWNSALAIQELPVNSAICSPAPGEPVSLGPERSLTIRGYAWSGGGRGIVRVDVTLDGGKSWHPAELSKLESLHYSRNWAWTLWTAKIPVPEKSASVEIWAKAVDSSYNTQPESFENIWNLRGVLGNAYHRVKVSINQV